MIFEWFVPLTGLQPHTETGAPCAPIPVVRVLLLVCWYCCCFLLIHSLCCVMILFFLMFLCLVAFVSCCLVWSLFLFVFCLLYSFVCSFVASVCVFFSAGFSILACSYLGFHPVLACLFVAWPLLAAAGLNHAIMVQTDRRKTFVFFGSIRAGGGGV